MFSLTAAKINLKVCLNIPFETKEILRQHNECCSVCSCFARGHYIYRHAEKSFIIIGMFLIGLQLGLFYLSALKTAHYFLKPTVENNFPLDQSNLSTCL